jgi:rare lipoprotein A
MGALALRRARPDRWTANAALLAMAGLTLAACASAPDRPLLGQVPDAGTMGEPSTRYSGYRVGKPYQARGVWYYPKDQPNYDEVGIASWYGEQFHNKFTADGEVFDMNMPSAAHKTLPLPSLVEVTNLTNGKTVILRVNDRGPFVDGRIIDLSKAAAFELGFMGQGLTKVRVRYVGRALDPPGVKSTPDWLDQNRQQIAAAAPPAPPPAKLQAPVKAAQANLRETPVRTASNTRASSVVSTQKLPDVDNLLSPSNASAPAQAASAARATYEMQTGAFPTYDSAERFALSLTGSGLPEVQTSTGGAGQAVYRVVVHGLANPAEAAAVQAQASALGAPQAAIVAGS